MVISFAGISTSFGKIHPVCLRIAPSFQKRPTASKKWCIPSSGRVFNMLRLWRQCGHFFPQTMTHMKSFLRAMDVYGRWINEVAKHARSLTEMSRMNVEMDWNHPIKEKYIHIVYDVEASNNHASFPRPPVHVQHERNRSLSESYCRNNRM